MNTAINAGINRAQNGCNSQHYNINIMNEIKNLRRTTVELKTDDQRPYRNTNQNGIKQRGTTAFAFILGFMRKLYTLVRKFSDL